MVQSPADAPTSAATDERKLRAFVEQVPGGQVISMQRQIRWRPAWFVEVARGSETLHIHIRGDRNSNILPFPELRREADILEVLEAHRIPVPHVWGVCPDPSAIIMDAVPGTREVAQAADDEERHSIVRQYATAVAAMHRIPVDHFVARGIELPRGAEAIALAGLTAYSPLYRHTKRRPEPLIEFAVGWLRRNVPRHRTRASFIQFDSGQFLFSGGKLTALYDFEFGMIGDPMTDLATMRMRESYEPLGDELKTLYRHYEAAFGEPIDVPVLKFHNALFSTVSCMQIAGAVADPQPGGPHDVYLEWDIALRRALVKILAECLDMPLPAIAAPRTSGSPNAIQLRMLRDALTHIDAAEGMPQARKQAALNLLECLELTDAAGADLERLASDEAVEFLGRRLADWSEREAALERFVQAAGPEQDAKLLRYFARQVERRVMLYAPTAVGRSASRVGFSPIR